MRSFFKTIFSLLFAILLISPFIKAQASGPALQDQSAIEYLINDQPVDSNPDLWEQKDLTTGRNADGSLPPLRIDGLARIVKITFQGPAMQNKDYYLCGKSDPDLCGNNPDSVFVAKFTSQNNQINVNVCGDGEDTLKGHAVDGGDNLHDDKGCDTLKDWFHEGHFYKLHLFEQNGKKISLLKTAQFFVQHSYPVIKIAPNNGTRFDPGTTPIKISLWGRRPGDNDQNNYQLSLNGLNNDFSKTKCKQDGNQIIPPLIGGETVGINTQGVNLTNQTVVPEHILNGTGWGIQPDTEDHAFNVIIGRGDTDNYGIGRGMFVLKINERVHEGRPLGVSRCDSSFSYMAVQFTIDPNASNGIVINKVTYDPDNADTQDLLNEEFGKQLKAPPPPCDPDSLDISNKNCTAVNTAIGKINTTPQGFVDSIFSFVLVLASFGGIIIIIYSGYAFMTSRGDKEKIAGARETLTSAIVGLLFIVLSIVILEIIGVDILRIPGFGR